MFNFFFAKRKVGWSFFLDNMFVFDPVLLHIEFGVHTDNFEDFVM